jgi:hypothetical protein
LPGVLNSAESGLIFSVSSGNCESNKKIQLIQKILLALLNLSKIRSEANLTGVYPVK